MMHKSILSIFCSISLLISSNIFATVEIRQDAPSRYTVKKGDTLWGISKKYLNHPWQWPKLWGFNKTQINNPHYIYPGQTLVLYYENGQPRLGFESGQDSVPVIKISPHVKDITNGYNITTLPMSLIKIFMDYPQLISKEETFNAPTIIKGSDQRLILAPSERVYAKGIDKPGRYLSYRVNGEVIDPDTKQSLGLEIIYSGELATLSPRNKKTLVNKNEQQFLEKGEYYTELHPLLKVPSSTAQPLSIVKATSEILVGDYLHYLPDESHERFNFMPHEPEGDVKAKIVKILNSTQLSESGQYQTILLNKGTEHGITKGTVLSIYKIGSKINMDVKPKKIKMKYLTIPAEELGTAIVYNTTPNTAYAIIIDSHTGISVGDIASNPGQDLDVIQP